ncbi:hypothetical protein EHI8A_005760 [Entamoeba histolytica HM-1:IMSS-B]|uniref:t-SNARE coiled-coil homology domain-containing protein n=8 Tax=Entamoeba TaxID=5758 RepID=C4M321_ENTH1|nr:hypothetical protein ENU1_178750 [Entamoeba nuttalli P19]XP_652944.1 hypothetical protein EHI_025340 [Entamoeba histolytica HM-1:IMSS]EMD46715.1 Hypothetical protein EHI5A_019600 [Entamoeba histolytica KU27]EMH74279.1 hypothetical protein EHI8A_005760 [Entamoeba histolytica HM-1:IMSS-B]EMS13707.1 hypothetical protein KM1_021450 [Entamoeba histolytica HM-3:IMSS]ENY65502.1 hypothetical protein EHI7A_009040 [Entamoeba histolytica HM-1:IMSS-A]GAT95696.1 hypothetical protein CL6EHI_025340 [Enta|eukprot:XP_008859639.1 hypothetical protein ENU1_178750 [Entamoeba nuttalli P19]
MTTNYNLYSNEVIKQNEMIESLGDIANRIHSNVNAITDELNVHSDLLDEIDEKTPLVHDHVKKTQSQLKTLLLRSEDKVRWSLICCLCCVLIIVIFLAITL